MATKVEAAHQMMVMAARRKDSGQRNDLEAGMAKYLASEYGKEVVEDSLRIHGGYGFSKEYEIERLYREVPMLLIGEGTAEIQKMIIGAACSRNTGSPTSMPRRPARPDQPGRAPVRLPDRPDHPPRRAQERAGPRSRHSRLDRELEPEPAAIRLDRDRRALARRLQAYLRWRNTHTRHPDVLAAQRRERARIRSAAALATLGPCET